MIGNRLCPFFRRGPFTYSQSSSGSLLFPSPKYNLCITVITTIKLIKYTLTLLRWWTDSKVSSRLVIDCYLTDRFLILRRSSFIARFSCSFYFSSRVFWWRSLASSNFSAFRVTVSVTFCAREASNANLLILFSSSSDFLIDDCNAILDINTS